MQELELFGLRVARSDAAVWLHLEDGNRPNEPH